MNARQRGAHVAPLQQVGHEHLEEQNDEEEKLLSKSVSALKSLSIDIGTEIRDQVRTRHMFPRILQLRIYENFYKILFVDFSIWQVECFD